MWLTLALACLGAQLLTLGILAWGGRAMRPFAPAPRDPGRPWPSASVLVAARDEAWGVEACVRSLFALDYADLELIAVDDRSTDATGAILDRLAMQDPRLKVIHVAALPPGWLGKNHAQWLGAGQAGGELLLFTDADIEFAPSALRDAVSILEAERLDHLALGPAMTLPGIPLAACIAYFGRQFALLMRPWRARDPDSDAYIGIGAFNLVRAAAYRAAGGHERIALRPDDDIRLGQILKQAGFRQDLRHAPDALRVTWYGSVGEFVRGLEKNVLAGFDYRGVLGLCGLALLLAIEMLPWAALAAAEGAARTAAATAIGVAMATQAAILHVARAPLAAALLQPFGALVFFYACTRSIVLAYARGGIVWRGTRYPLADLRRNKL
ncbi:MAG: glycosyltransferase [Betaproteobacteria bacterium]